jgi:tRNA A37 threonylcarbamoyltransferase TsaD
LERFCTVCSTEDHKEDLPSIPLISRPFVGQLQFSFSGLHSFVKQFINRQAVAIDIPTKRALARAFQTAAVGQLEEKLLLALKWCEMNGIIVQEIVVSGGVASNKFLRERYIMLQAMKILFNITFSDCTNVFSHSLQILRLRSYFPRPIYAQVSLRRAQIKLMTN